MDPIADKIVSETLHCPKTEAFTVLGAFAVKSRGLALMLLPHLTRRR